MENRKAEIDGETGEIRVWREEDRSPRFPPRRLEEIVGERRAGGETRRGKKSFWTNERALPWLG